MRRPEKPLELLARARPCSRWRQRHAIVAVWDFCRAVDDAVDEEPAGDDAPSGRDAVTFWRAELARCYNGDRPTSAQGMRLQPFIRRFDLPRQGFDDVIDGVEMDLDRTHYETFGELLQYCRRVASAVGSACPSRPRCAAIVDPPGKSHYFARRPRRRAGRLSS